MQRLHLVTAIAALTFLGSCSGRPEIRADTDPNVDMASYKTFAFFELPSSNREGYSTLVTSRLKEATRRELEQRGCQFAQEGAQLMVNFNINIEHRTDVQSVPSPAMGGYYGYRGGMYGVWGGYPQEVQTTHYRVGTLAIDVVDAAKKQLVWQGVAEGRISRESTENPGPAIDEVVAEIFALYPIPAPAQAR